MTAARFTMVNLMSGRREVCARQAQDEILTAAATAALAPLRQDTASIGAPLGLAGSDWLVSIGLLSPHAVRFDVLLAPLVVMTHCMLAVTDRWAPNAWAFACDTARFIQPAVRFNPPAVPWLAVAIEPDAVRGHRLPSPRFLEVVAAERAISFALLALLADAAPIAGAPGFWMHETSGVLRPAVEAYLAGGPMTQVQIGAMRAYLRQWIEAPGFAGPEVGVLRLSVGTITDRAGLDRWLDQAMLAGVDPL